MAKDKLNTMTFRGLRFRQDALTLVNKEESAPYCRLHVRCDLSKPVLEAMSWSIGEGQAGGSLVGVLNGTHAVWTPADKGLQRREMQMEVGAIDKFRFVPLMKDGEISGHELLFEIRTSNPDAPAMVMEYISACGGERCAMKLTFSKEPVQAVLPGTEETPEPEAA